MRRHLPLAAFLAILALAAHADARVSYRYDRTLYASGDVIGWSDSATDVATLDVGLARAAAGVLEVTDGSTGSGALDVPTIYGGAVTGDDLALRANSVDASPSVTLNGAGDIVVLGNFDLDSDTTGAFFGDGQDASIIYDGTDLRIDPKVVGAGTLIIEGSMTVDIDLDVSGDGDVTGDLDLGGDARIVGTLSAGEATFTADVAVTGSISAGANVDVTGTMAAATITASGDTALAGSLSVGVDLDVAGVTRTLRDIAALTTDTALAEASSFSVRTNRGAGTTVVATLPASPTQGATFTFVRVTAQAFRIHPGAEAISYSGGTLASGVYLELGSTGAQLELVYDGTDWLAIREMGTLNEAP